MEQPLGEQLDGRRAMLKTGHEVEECVVVNEQGEPIDLPPGCEIVYENAADGGDSFQS